MRSAASPSLGAQRTENKLLSGQHSQEDVAFSVDFIKDLEEHVLADARGEVENDDVSVLSNDDDDDGEASAMARGDRGHAHYPQQVGASLPSQALCILAHAYVYAHTPYMQALSNIKLQVFCVCY